MTPDRERVEDEPASTSPLPFAGTRESAPAAKMCAPLASITKTQIVGAALVVFVGLMTVAPRYGFHRDELYYMSNGDHLAWGYVDHPPLTPVLGVLSQALFGHTVAGLRVVPAAIAAAIVAAAALVCREVGGSRRACALSAWATATTATVMATGHMLATPTVDVFASTIAIWLLCRAVRTDDARWFLAIGVVVGVGLLNKFTMLLPVAGFGVALLATPQRRLLTSAWCAGGALVAAVIWSPHLWWQHRHGWPFFEFTAAIAEEATDNRLTMLPLVPLLAGPPVAAIVTVAWWRTIRHRLLEEYRFLAIGAAVTVTLVAVTGGKPYYTAGVLPASIAVGAIWWDRRRRCGRLLVPGLLVVNAAFNALLTLPILPVGVVARSPIAAANPDVAETIGWREFTSQVAAEYRALDDGRGTTVILTANYGEAGAIDQFGPELGLPGAFSGHNSYADLGPPPPGAAPILVVGDPDPSDHFDGCRRLPAMRMPHDVDNEEQDAPMWACDTPRRPWAELWPDLRHID